MRKQILRSPEAPSPVQAQRNTQGEKNMKKVIVSLTLTAVLAVAAIAPNFSFNHLGQDSQAIINNFDSNLLMAGGGDGWNGG